MIVLDTTTKKLQVVLGGAITTNQLQCVASWRDRTSTTFVAGATEANTNSGTDVDLVAAPAASTQRLIDFVNIYNRDTVSATVTVKIDISGTEYILWKGTLVPDEVLQYIDGTGWVKLPPLTAAGYAINVQALTSSPADTTPFYFGTKPAAITTTAGQNKIYIRRAGTLRIAEIYTYAGTAGTGENVSMYVRVNNTTDYLIQTVGLAANERVFTNAAMNITLNVGDYIEIKCIPPAWATNPLTFIVGGYVYIE
jgi:hypothetical protein